MEAPKMGHAADESTFKPGSPAVKHRGAVNTGLEVPDEHAQAVFRPSLRSDPVTVSYRIEPHLDVTAGRDYRPNEPSHRQTSPSTVRGARPPVNSDNLPTRQSKEPAMPEFIGPIEAKFTAKQLDNADHMDADGWRNLALSALEQVLWSALNQPQYTPDGSNAMRAEWRLRQAEFTSI